MTTTDKANVSIARDRLDRVVRALEDAAMGDFKAAKDGVGTPAGDTFGLMEAALLSLIGGMEAALEDNRGMYEQSLKNLVAAQTLAEQQRETIQKLAAEQLIGERQRQTIRQLSTPIIDVWDGVVALPIVGFVDTQRTVEMTEQLLERIVRTSTKHVIIDLTAIETIDTSTADHLVKLTRAAGLLGTHCVVTGIGAEMARTLSSIGVTLGDIKTLRTLRDGLRYCIVLSARGQDQLRVAGKGAPARAGAA